MSSADALDPKEIMMKVLRDWWYSQGGETRYHTLKNFAGEIGIMYETFSGIWRGRGFPAPATFEKLASVVPLASTARKLGFRELAWKNGPNDSTSTIVVEGAPVPGPPVEVTEPTLELKAPVPSHSLRSRWTKEMGSAFSIALRRWWEVEGVYAFGTRNQLSRVLLNEFLVTGPSHVTWLRWFKSEALPDTDRQLTLVDVVTCGLRRWGFDPDAMIAVELPKEADAVAFRVTLESPISALLKNDMPPMDRALQAVAAMRTYGVENGKMAILVQQPSSWSTSNVEPDAESTQTLRPRLRPDKLQSPQATAEEKDVERSTQLSPSLQASIDISGAMDVLRAEVLTLRSELRAMRHELELGVHAGELSIGKRKNGMRFIVTADSFRLIGVSPTIEEIVDTDRLMEELMRRLEVFAAQSNEAVRTATQKKLQRRAQALLVSVTRFLSQWSEGLNRMLDMYRETLEQLPNK